LIFFIGAEEEELLSRKDLILVNNSSDFKADNIELIRESSDLLLIFKQHLETVLKFTNK